MRVELTFDDCYCNLLTFYENVARKMGVVLTGSTRFDCRKICVTEGVQSAITGYYYGSENLSRMQIAAIWLQVGPKASLGEPELYFADVEDGFVVAD